MRKILLIDGTNNFIRNYCAKSDLAEGGEPVGGVVGFLQSLGQFVSFTSPDEIIIVWDGPGGSRRRRSVNKTYKDGRKYSRLNRNFDFEHEGAEENKVWQRNLLARYLRFLPVKQMIIADIEADDVIAYCVRYIFEKDLNFIVSNDRDFLQLLRKNVVVYRPSAKSLMTVEKMIEEHGIHPTNFALAKAIVGDKSDNILGVRGIGFKMLIRYFPQFIEESKITLDDFFSLCKSDEKYARFLESRELVISNHRLVQLENPLVGHYSVQKINEALAKKAPFNATFLRVQLQRDGISTVGEKFLTTFKSYRAEKEELRGYKISE